MTIDMIDMVGPSNYWRSMDSAPLDGTSILLYNGWQYQVCHYGFSSLWDIPPKEWIYGECEGEYNSYPYFNHPTHWMPLPAPPIVVEGP